MMTFLCSHFLAIVNEKVMNLIKLRPRQNKGFNFFFRTRDKLSDEWQGKPQEIIKKKLFVVVVEMHSTL